ncbi:ABC transporter ATP-binding protein [Piscinibacter sakaiensis]|uniref:ABC transporter ATP-binding protein n=1 Tax=Piscinibacter sakaiensis TaxID=1547922 RepID=UPI003AAC3BEF
MNEAGQSRADVLLRLHDVSKRFGGVLANDGISFDVPRGALVGLIGPNGSGKTTLLNAIAGLAPPDAGTVVFDGRVLAKLGSAATARLGLLRTFQDAGIFGGISVLQNMLASRPRAGERLPALWQRGDRATAERAMQWLDFVGLAAQREQPAGELSYGQRKLLEFAMALMGEPRMLLLDEPTAGVSPAMVPQLVDRLRRANAELGITLLFVEHNMQVVVDLAQQVVCLARGRVLARGTPAEIRADDRVIEAYLGAA